MPSRALQDLQPNMMVYLRLGHHYKPCLLNIQQNINNQTWCFTCIWDIIASQVFSKSSWSQQGQRPNVSFMIIKKRRLCISFYYAISLEQQRLKGVYNNINHKRWKTARTEISSVLNLSIKKKMNLLSRKLSQKNEYFCYSFQNNKITDIRWHKMFHLPLHPHAESLTMNCVCWQENCPGRLMLECTLTFKAEMRRKINLLVFCLQLPEVCLSGFTLLF